MEVAENEIHSHDITKKTAEYDKETILIKGLNLISKDIITINLELVDSNIDNNISMCINYNNKKYFSRGECYFPVFQQLKDELLIDNFGLQCYGSLINAHASGMMEFVPKVYLLTMGEQARMKDIVIFFDYINIFEFATKKEQDTFFIKWIKSIQAK